MPFLCNFRLYSRIAVLRDRKQFLSFCRATACNPYYRRRSEGLARMLVKELRRLAVPFQFRAELDLEALRRIAEHLGRKL